MVYHKDNPCMSHHHSMRRVPTRQTTGQKLLHIQNLDSRWTNWTNRPSLHHLCLAVKFDCWVTTHVDLKGFEGRRLKFNAHRMSLLDEQWKVRVEVAISGSSPRASTKPTSFWQLRCSFVQPDMSSVLSRTASTRAASYFGRCKTCWVGNVCQLPKELQRGDSHSCTKSLFISIRWD